ncbi:MAG: hypothetical protein H0U70_02280 [Tatlockia sp.]|nr:hypothetical protein [Tatlockia sp.]
MNHDTLVTDTAASCNMHNHARISWSAVFAGAFVGLGLSFLLQLFSLAIGLSAYNSNAGATTIAMGGFLGLLIGGIAAMGAAGFVSGYLGRFHFTHGHGGIVYGFVTWSLALLLAAIFVIPLSHYMSAYNRSLAPKVMVSDTMTQRIDITETTNASNKPAANQPVVKVDSDTLTGSSWLIFLLFSLGALSSCVGACWAMSCKRRDLDDMHSDAIPVARKIR